MARRLPVPIGEEFGAFVVVAERPAKRNNSRWLFRCKHCGTEKEMYVYDARRVKGCGCRKRGRLRHGHAYSASWTPTYSTWVRMRERCRDENHVSYPWYGGRGITVCDRWDESYEAFLKDMGERPAGHSIDRIDPDGNYEPSNCRWATREVQRSNQRKRRSVST